MTRSPKPITPVRLMFSAASGALAVAGLSYLARLADNDSLARGIVAGGIGGIAIVLTLLVLSRTRFSTPEARLTAGKADERESRLATRSAAIAGIAMYAAAVVAVFLTAFGVEPQAGYAIIMFTGLLAGAISYAVSVRRG